MKGTRWKTIHQAGWLLMDHGLCSNSQVHRSGDGTTIWQTEVLVLFSAATLPRCSCSLVITLTMLLNSLPPEIVLQILSHLPVSSLAIIHALSRAWNSFLLHHETTIYRYAACLHGIIQDDAASFDAATLRQRYSQRVLRNVDSWKALCTIHLRLQRTLSLTFNRNRQNSHPHSQRMERRRTLTNPA